MSTALKKRSACVISFIIQKVGFYQGELLKICLIESTKFEKNIIFLQCDLSLDLYVA